MKIIVNDICLEINGKLRKWSFRRELLWIRPAYALNEKS